MRNPKRIERILAGLKDLWNKYPDMRLGQLLENFVFGHHLDRNCCIFYQEDSNTEQKLEALLARAKIQNSMSMVQPEPANDRERMLIKWPKFLEHVRELNAKGYNDYEVPSLGIRIGFGYWHHNTKYVVISVTDDSITDENEICAVGFDSSEAVKHHLIEDESNWENDSVWKDGERVNFQIKVDFVE